MLIVQHQTENLGMHHTMIPTAYLWLSCQILAEVLGKVFDSSISFESISPNFPADKLTLDFSCLLNAFSEAPEPRPSKIPPHYAILRQLAQQAENMALLTHPLVKAFLYTKWLSAKLFVYINVVLTLLTHLAMTCVAYESKVTLPGEPPSTQDALGSLYSSQFLQIVAFICICILGARELSSLATKRLDYLKQGKNYLDLAWLAAGTTITANYLLGQTVLSTYSHQVAAVTIVLGSFEAMLALGSCWPTVGEYVLMFVVVVKNFVVYSAAYVSLILGFGLGFHVLFPWKDGFKHAWTSIARALVMMSGELDFNSAFFEAETTGELLIAMHS